MAKPKKPRPIGPRDEMGGREVESRRIEFYEKAQGTPAGTTTYAPKLQPMAPLPPGASRGKGGMTDRDMEQFRKDNPDLYRRGGKVRSTRRM